MGDDPLSKWFTSSGVSLGSGFLAGGGAAMGTVPGEDFF
jgi:hypothetical protein